MLLLVTILLVVVGAISLAIGYANSSLVPIYVSIGCSIVAAAVLLIFSRKTRKSNQVVSHDGPSTLGFGASTRDDRTETVPAMAGARFGSSSGETFAPDSADDDGGSAAALDDSDDFPIDRYDSRRVGEILPLLAELDIDELDQVREREEQGKGRATVLARIDQLIEQFEEEDRQEEEHRFDAPAALGDEDADEDDDDDDELVAPTASVPAVSVAALPEEDDYFPIEEYDDLRASEILPLLPELDDDELEMVRVHEAAGAARSSILHRIDALLEVDEPEPEPVVAVVVAPVLPANKAAKAPAPRAVKAASPRATTARTAPAVVPAKASRMVKAAPSPSSVPAAKATKARAKAAPAPAALPVKKAPTARKAAPAVKAPVEKAAPVKRVTQKRAATPVAKATKAAAKTTKR